MSRKDRKRHLRELTRSWSEQERAEIESRMPFAKELLEALVATLDDELFLEERASCDHTLRRTQAFLEKREAWSQEAQAWLAERGGFCDCEVVYNVGDWLDGGF